MATKLQSHFLKAFNLGYNSYSQSKTMIKDEEFAYGQNVELDDNGSVQKRSGSRRYSIQVAPGRSIQGMIQFKSPSINSLICAAGTNWYNCTTTTAIALTGATFADSLATDYCQAFDRLYGANGTDPLSYTTDASSINQVTTFGNIGRFPVFFGGRIFMTNSAFPDRIYFSNTITPSAVPNTGYTVGNFGTFDTDLNATPQKKNAGFLQIAPGSGVVIIKLFVDGDQGSIDSLFVYTERNGIYKFDNLQVDGADGHITMSTSHTNAYFSTPAPRSVLKVANDQEFYGGDNLYSLGAVALYNNVRVSVKSGRIKSEMIGVPAPAKKNFVNSFFKTDVYSAYTGGTFNDRMIVRNTVLNAYSAPWVGINSSCMIEYIEPDGTRRLLSGSSDPSNSYIYELQSGLDDAGVPVKSYFETKSTDCDMPGRVKRLGFVKVYYALVYGTITYEVFADEISSITGSITFGQASSGSSGFGMLPFGMFAFGMESSAGATNANQAINGVLTIPCNYVAGTRFSVRFTNSNLNEQFKINAASFHFLPGSIFETIN